MKIDTTRLQELNSVLTRFIERGRQDTESFLIDPKDEYIYFNTSTTHGRIRVPMELEDDEEIAPFFVDATKFLHMVNRYSSVNLNENLVFSSGQDKFRFPTFRDESFEKQIVERKEFGVNCRENEIIYDSEFLDYLKKANRFVDKRHNRVELRGAFLAQGKLFAVSKALVFEAQTDKTSVDHALTKTMIDVVLRLGEGTVVQKCEGPYRIVNVEYEIEIIIPHDNSLTAPDVFSEKFVESYDHDTKIVVSKNDIRDAIDFVSGYARFEDNDSIRLTIDDDVLAIESTENDLFHKVVPLNYVDDDIEGLSFLVSTTKLETALKTVRSDNIRIQLDAIHPLIRIVGMEDETFHVVLAKIKE